MAFYPINIVAQKWEIYSQLIRDMMQSGAIPETVIDNGLIWDEFVEIVAQSQNNIIELLVKHIKLLDPIMSKKQTSGNQINNWKGGYQPSTQNIKIDPKTGLPPLPKGGTAEVTHQNILAHYKIIEQNKTQK
jgi:hypothetical protein